MIEKNINREKVVKTISGNWENWKLARSEKETVWDNCYKNYLGYIDQSAYDEWPWRCKVSRPISQEMSDTISAAVKVSLFPDNEDFFTIEGTDNVGEVYAKDVENYLKTVLYKMRYISLIVPFVKQLCIIGNSHAFIPWRTESVSRKRWRNGEITRYKQKIWDGPKIEVSDMFDVVFDPRAVSYSPNLPRIRRKIININELKNKKSIYSNLGSKKLQGGVPREAADSHREARRSIYGMNEGIVDKTGDVELLLASGDFNIGGKIHYDSMFVVANRSVLLQAIENPYWCGIPAVFSTYSPLYNELLGRGPLEPITGLQALIDTFSCQKADLSNLTIGGFWAYVNDGIIDPENLISKPYGMVEVENINNIKSLIPSANPTLAFSEIEDLRREAETSTGASKFAQGVVQPGRRTATETMQISSGTNTRFNDIITYIGEAAIEPSLNMILQQEFQFNYRNPGLEAMAWEGAYKVNFHGARASAVKEFTAEMLSRFTQVVAGSKMLEQFIDPQEFIKEWQKVLNIKNKKLARQTPISEEFPEIAGNNNGAMTGG